MADPSAEFRRELKSLRDQTNAALDGAAVGDLEDALDLYAGLVAAVLRTFNELQKQLGVEAPSWFNPYGQEMEWLEEDIRSFIERTPIDRPTPMFDELLRFLLAVLNQFLEAHELAAHRRFLHLAEVVFFRSLSSPIAPRSAAASVLAAVNSHGQYRVAMAGARLGEATAAQALRQVVDFLFSCFRLAVQDDKAAHADLCIEAAADLLETLEFATARSGSHRPSAVAPDAELQIQAYGLGAAALVLLASEQGMLNADVTAGLFERAVQLVPSDGVWRALVEAHDDRGQDFPWSNWEIGFWPRNVRSGTLGHLESAIDRVAALRLLRGSVSSPTDGSALMSLPPAQASAMVGRVLSQLDLAADAETNLLQAPDRADTSAVRQALAHTMDAFDTTDRQGRSLLPIDPSRVKKFLEAAENTWLQRSALSAAAAEVIESGVGPTELFGLSSVTPKDFFTASEVFAEPNRIGENMANALRRGESKQILDVAGQAGQRELSLSQLRDEVVAALVSLREIGCTPSVIAVNSWRVAHELTASYEAGGTGGAAEIEGATVEVEYVGDIALCVVGDLSKAISIHRWRLESTSEEQHLLAGGLLRAGIRDITPEYAAEVVDSNPGFLRDDNGNTISRDEAIQRLENTVNTRLFCKTEVKLADISALVVFRVRESE